MTDCRGRWTRHARISAIGLPWSAWRETRQRASDSHLWDTVRLPPAFPAASGRTLPCVGIERFHDRVAPVPDVLLRIPGVLAIKDRVRPDTSIRRGSCVSEV